jgi:hypothetical protein
MTESAGPLAIPRGAALDWVAALTDLNLASRIARTRQTQQGQFHFDLRITISGGDPR